MWSWRSGGGLGKAGGSVRQRTKAQVGEVEGEPRGWGGLGGTQI